MGDITATTQLANAVLSCLDQMQPSVQVTKEDKTEVRDENIYSDSKIKGR